MKTLKRTGRILMIACLVLTVAAGSALAKKPWEKIKIPELNEIRMPEYTRVELDNGMVLFLAEDHELPLVQLSATVDVGSIYEPVDKLGLASMTGSVMRTGGTSTRSGDDIDELVEARGLAVETYIGQTSGGAYLSAMAGNYQARLFKIMGLRFNRKCVITNQRPNFFHHGGMMTGLNAAIMQQLNRAAQQIGQDPIDMFLANPELRRRLKRAFHQIEVKGSDHCPIGLELR